MTQTTALTTIRDDLGGDWTSLSPPEHAFLIGHRLHMRKSRCITSVTTQKEAIHSTLTSFVVDQ